MSLLLWMAASVFSSCAVCVLSFRISTTSPSTPSMAIAKNLMEMLVPFVKESVGEINLPDRTLTMEKTDGEIAEDNLDWEKEADMDAALDFADSF